MAMRTDEEIKEHIWFLAATHYKTSDGNQREIKELRWVLGENHL